ncbi:hypothetical protein MNBD_DELTA03-717 [hydrothermal vent metagenome]|uniref:Cysteine dioxygenase n=1 Tax=hydrothermal vent metagenome TaxID=652676 RepID=A0A3B0VE42_9ZZZZ
MIIRKPQTYMGHPNQEYIRIFLRELFSIPDPEKIAQKTVSFLSDHPVPLSDFPPFAPLYSRTILYRAENHYEAMAARWSKDAISVIHGHPMFAFYYLLEGELSVECFEKSGAKAVRTDTRIYKPGQYFSMLGTPDTFDNGIHRVSAKKESLSIHIYSDDAMKGQIFTI